MSFAKHQEEETASVPGVSYADTTNRNEVNRDISSREDTNRNYSAQANGRRDGSQRARAPSMDVEMGLLGDRRSRSGAATRVTFAEAEGSNVLL